MQRFCGADLCALVAEDALRSVFPFARFFVDLHVHGADAQALAAVNALILITVEGADPSDQGRHQVPELRRGYSVQLAVLRRLRREDRPRSARAGRDSSGKDLPAVRRACQRQRPLLQQVRRTAGVIFENTDMEATVNGRSLFYFCDGRSS